MLVLSRKLEQEILIGGNIVLKVVSIKGGVIRLGISAPNDVRIVRAELLDDNSENGGTEDVKVPAA